MSMRSKYTFSILAILAIAMSVYVCAGIAMGSVHGMHVGGIATIFEHMSHVRSLTLAIVPMLVLFIFSFCLRDLARGLGVLDFSFVYLHALEDSPSPKQKQKKRHFSHPRSPPFC